MTAATGYRLTGPGAGPQGLQSAEFVVTLVPAGSETGRTTITPASTVAGTFSPPAVRLGVGVGQATFTFTPSAAGTATISVTNSRSLSDPPALSVVVTPSAGPPNPNSVQLSPDAPQPGDLSVTGDAASGTAHVGQTSPDLTQDVVGTVLAKLAFAGGSVGSPHGACLLHERYLVLPTNDGSSHQARVLDCLTPRAPQLIATIASTLDATGSAVRVDDDTIVLTAESVTGKLFEVWDLSTPSAPALLAAPSGGGGEQLYAGFGACCVGSLLVGARGAGDGIVRIWDLFVRATPVARGTLDTTGTLQGNPGVMTPVGAHHVAIWEEPGDHTVIHLVSLADPDSPADVGSIDLPSNFAAFDAVLLDTATLAVAASTGSGSSVFLIDVTDPTTPVLLATITSTLSTFGLSVVPAPGGVGGTVILSTNDAGAPYESWDATGDNRAAPVLLGRFPAGTTGASQGNLYALRYPYLAGDAWNQPYVLTFVPLLPAGAVTPASQHESLATTLLDVHAEASVGWQDGDGVWHGSLRVKDADALTADRVVLKTVPLTNGAAVSLDPDLGAIFDLTTTDAVGDVTLNFTGPGVDGQVVIVRQTADAGNSSNQNIIYGTNTGGSGRPSPRTTPGAGQMVTLWFTSTGTFWVPSLFYDPSA